MSGEVMKAMKKRILFLLGAILVVGIFVTVYLQKHEPYQELLSGEHVTFDESMQHPL